MVANRSGQPPREIGGYEVVEPLARTDASAIFKARDPHSGALVAIKLAGRAVVTDRARLARFEQEYLTLRALEHPHLVRALGYGLEGRAPYMVLEYVDGTNLHELIERRGPLPEAEAVRVITQVGQALHHAHQHGVIHRDVKPGNVLLTKEGVAKLADLGLANDSAVLLARASTGLLAPTFLAPEQTDGSRPADPRCDVYALAATLYVALTGRLPFVGKSATEVWKKKLTNDCLPPDHVVAGLSPTVQAAVVRALDVDPAARPASCRHFLDELTGKTAAPQDPTPDQPAPDARKGRGKRRPPERRVSVRYGSEKPGCCQPVTRGDEMEWVGRVQDISAEGIGLLLCRRFEKGTALMVDLASTPDKPGGRLLARVVRVETVSPRCWLLGCVFAKPLTEEEVQAMR
jgi:serine/threonine protein kinase